MNIIRLSAVLIAGGLLMAAPAMAQTTPTAKTAQADALKQHTEGYLANSMSTGAPGSGATKQRTSEGQSDGDLNIGPASKAKPQ